MTENIHRQAYEAKLMKQFPNMSLEEAIEAERLRMAEVGRANAGKSRPNARFKDIEKAREAQRKSVASRLANKSKQ